MRIFKWIEVRLLVALLALVSSVAHADPENGWWWNPAEDGRGFFIEVQESQLFMAAYLYEDDGRGTWVVSSGAMTDPNTYNGRLLSVRGGQTLLGDYQPPAAVTDVGALALNFTDPTHGTLTWPGGVVPIQRQGFGGTVAAFQPTGWWWNPDESGRGFSIEVQGDRLFMAAFMYDGSGNPVWYISSGQMSSPTQFNGVLQQVSGGQTMGGPYKFPTAIQDIGPVSIEFDSLEDASITLSDGSVAKIHIDKAPRKVPIKPELRRRGWVGPFEQKHVTYDGLVYTTAVWSGNVLLRNDLLKPRSTFVATGNYTIEVTGSSDGVCSYTGSVVGKFTWATDSEVIVSADGTFTGRLVPTDQPIKLVFDCPNLPTPDPITIPSIAFLELGFKLNGKLDALGAIFGIGEGSYVLDPL